MAAHVSLNSGTVGISSPSPIAAQWNEQKQSTSTQESSNRRSVTPAMNNTRGAVSSGARSYSLPLPTTSSVAARNPSIGYYDRSATPQRFYGAYSKQNINSPRPSSSTGLIRLILRKPMGIVFEPMYDPHNPSLQRGVRICDLPRTGAAALSRSLEVGDELLSINDKTMSRLTFDEVMDFIIEANPEHVNLLFRRPRKETLVSRQVKPSNSNNNITSVKWIDDDHRNKKKKSKEEVSSKREKKSKPRSKTEEEDTIQSTESDHPFQRKKGNRNRGKVPYESESFLDLLIDSICANTDNVCRDSSGADRRRGDDDYYSDEDDRTFTSADDSTYVTYESEQISASKEKRSQQGQNRDSFSSLYDDTEDDTHTSLEDEKKKKTNLDKIDTTSPRNELSIEGEKNQQKRLDKAYEDDATLETVETAERAKEVAAHSASSPPPLGLVPNEKKKCPGQDDVVDVPIAELEYDGQIDHGADVSVMESLGGPSLLIEKQRHAAALANGHEPNSENVVSRDLVSTFGMDYPADFGFSREQTVHSDPFKFYTFVVKKLLQEHEPEKVRLLDKLLAKYQGREEHLIRKLSVRYDRFEEKDTPVIPEGDEGGFTSFVMDVNRNKESGAAAASIQSAKERLGVLESENCDWVTGTIAKDESDQERSEEKPQHDDESQGSESYSASEFSGDSIDGTSPAVIAQVSELLNYVYGKTSVPGQIDRVSTIMRAYEGREAVLLELLETKALIKANADKEIAVNLPSFLRNSPALRNALEKDAVADAAVDVASPVSGLTNVASPNDRSGALIQDDISSMSGISAPANGHMPNVSKLIPEENVASTSKHQPTDSVVVSSKEVIANSDSSTSAKVRHTAVAEKTLSSEDIKTTDRDKKKKKKGLFGGLFGKKGKKSKGHGGTSATYESSRGGKKGLVSTKIKKGSAHSIEGSI